MRSCAGGAVRGGSGSLCAERVVWGVVQDGFNMDRRAVYRVLNTVKGGLGTAQCRQQCHLSIYIPRFRCYV